MHRNQRLVVLLNRNESDSELIRFAAMFCSWETVHDVQFVHVLPRDLSDTKVAGYQTIVDELDQIITRHFAISVAAPPALETVVLSGPLTDRVLAHLVERQSDLVLLGEGSAEQGRRSLARRLAMKATCSVLMMPNQSPTRLRQILVPIDFSKHSEDTLRVAVSLARLAGATCRPIHVYFNEAVVTFEEYDQILRGQERNAYERFIAAIDCSGVEMRPLFVESSNVPHALLRSAEQEPCELIVMGTRGRSRSASILLGSVTDEMLRQTRVPLLAVKHFGAQMNVLETLLDRRFRRGGRLHTD